MEEFRKFDLVAFAILGIWYVSKLYRVEGKFGYVDYLIYKGDGGLFQHIREHKVSLSDVNLIMRKTNDVFSRRKLQNIFKEVMTITL